MTKIKLPPLPESFPAGYIARTEYFYTAAQVRAIQLETARAVQEACVRVCEEWEKQNWVYRNGAIQCVKAIRALEFDV